MAPTPVGRELIDYFRTGDEAAVACWCTHVADSEMKHERASRLHGGPERGGRQRRS